MGRGKNKTAAGTSLPVEDEAWAVFLGDCQRYPISVGQGLAYLVEFYSSVESETIRMGMMGLLPRDTEKISLKEAFENRRPTTKA